MTNSPAVLTARTSMSQGDLYRFVQKIPRGNVASYGFLAKLLGCSPRLVGRYLHQNPDARVTPCHRVVHADGSLAGGYAFGGLDVQRQLLEREGVPFVKNRIVKTAFVTTL